MTIQRRSRTHRRRTLGGGSLWYTAGGTIPEENILEWVELPTNRQLYTGDDAKAAFTIAIKTSFAGGNQFAFDSQTGRLVLGESSQGDNGFYIGSTWHERALFPTDSTDRVYFLISDGSSVQAYRDGTAIGDPVASAVNISNTTRWRGAYLDAPQLNWDRAMPYGVVYNIALDAAQRAALLLALGIT